MAYCDQFPDLDSLNKKGNGTAEIQYILLTSFNKFEYTCQIVRNGIGPKNGIRPQTTGHHVTFEVSQSGKFTSKFS